MSAKLTDRSPEFRARYREAARLGVDAAANVLEREVAREFFSRKGYKTGAFAGSLRIGQSVRRSPPEQSFDAYTGAPIWVSRVGTNKLAALYWELGHYNIFTRGYERVRIWVPTASRNVERARRAFAAVVARVMGGPASTPTTPGGPR